MYGFSIYYREKQDMSILFFCTSFKIYSLYPHSTYPKTIVITFTNQSAISSRSQMLLPENLCIIHFCLTSSVVIYTEYYNYDYA